MARLMNAKECYQRASECAANAAISADELVSLEFLKLAAHWRALAVRAIFLGHVADPISQIGLPTALALPAG